MTRPLILVPIESLTERYTEQWHRNIPPVFRAYGFDVTVIEGQPLLDNDIKVGAFLDINSTAHYKWSQLQQISALFHHGKVAPNTVFFFSDIEFWGLEAVRLLADMNQIPVKIAGFLHAASYTREDAFSIAAPYQQYTEVGWIAALDKVFVGTHYHKSAVVERRLLPLQASELANRIMVTGNPLFPSEYPDFNVPKENIVVLTNRFDYEKRPNKTLELFARAKRKFPDWRFLVCTGRKTLRSNKPELVAQARELERQGVVEIHDGLTKNQYHEILARSKIMVSHSVEENFGYSIIESMLYNCTPLLRKGVSHSELVQIDNCLFTDRPDHDYTKLVHLMQEPQHPTFKHIVSHYSLSLARIAEALVSL